MTTFTVKTLDYAQRAGLLAYMKKQNIKFEIAESENESMFCDEDETILTPYGLKRIEESMNSGFCTDISGLKEYVKSQI